MTFEQVQKTLRKKEGSVDANGSRLYLVFIEGQGGEELTKVLMLQRLRSRVGRNGEYEFPTVSHF